VLGIIFKGASIVKHIAIDYRYIKASGIQEAINMFGKDARLTEDGQIEVAIVEDIEQLQNSFTLVNTGLKVDGASIYRIKNTDLLMFGAKGQQSIKIVQTINGTEQLKQSVMEILKSSGQQIDDIETQGIVTKQGEGIEVKEGIIEIGEMELKGKTSQQIKEFITSSLEINRATGIMYGQKTIIGLEYIGASDINKLKSAIENGRARKVITKEQYIALRAYMNENKENSFNEYLLELRKNGIEIYIDAREQVIEQKEIEDGIAGQIVTENGELYIQDYYSLEQTKLLKVDSEMLKERSLEQIILSESETIFVGIEILLEQFRQSNINVVQREFGALLGKIKLSLNIGELNFKDIENILYNIDYNKIPKLELAPSKNLQEYTKEDINAMIDSLILNMEETSEISIILKAIRKNKNFNEQDYDAFVQVIKERILAKTALIKGYKEYGLKDKRLEKLLGQLLFKQLDFNLEDKDPKEEKNFDFTYIDKDEQIRVVNGYKEKSEDNKEAEYVFMRKIVQDTEKARRGDKVAINSIIDIILTYGDEYKEKQLARDMDKNDIRNYRAMMSAA
jgi:RNAse (barnase) inhibitor barstar